MHVLLVLLIMIVALGRGGYDPWATLVLELGAVGFALWLVLDVIKRTGPAERRRILEQQRALKRLPFLERHPWIRLRKRRRTQVTILPPGSFDDEESVSFDDRSHVVVLGFPFKRTGLGVPIFLLSLWIAVSLVPLDPTWLEAISPEAYSLRSEVEPLVGGEVGPSPLSLAPFLTLRDLWQWISYLILFYAAFRLSERSKNIENLTLGLFLCGIALGGYGILQWLLGLQSQAGAVASIAGIRARGPFGNPNHYAAFLGMILLCSLRWLASRNAQSSRNEKHRTGREGPQETRAKLILGGLGIVIIGVGIIFSLSRSGIAFALAGCVALAFLTKREAGLGEDELDTIDLHRGSRRIRNHRSTRGYWALALAVAGFTAWIGIEPVLSRFGELPRQLEVEKARPQVWKDSVGAVQDFWRTGSGLSSYRYLTSNYRTFSGCVFYSWAHNDYLQLLIELGLPGVFLLFWILIAVWEHAHRAREELATNPSLLHLHLHAGYCSAAVVIALHSFTDFSLHLPANFALFSIIIGVVVGLEAEKKEDPGRRDRQPSVGRLGLESSKRPPRLPNDDSMQHSRLTSGSARGTTDAIAG